MKKKLLSIFLTAALIATMLVGCGSSSNTPAGSDVTEKSTEASVSSEGNGEKVRIGVLSILNITEDEYTAMDKATIKAIKILEENDSPTKDYEVVFYDNLDAMQMALQAGDIDRMRIPKSTADYLIANNDRMQILSSSDKSDKLNDEAQCLLKSMNSTGFAFMMRGDSEKLRDDFDDALDEMKEDGTLDKLIKEYITDVVDGKDPKAVEFEDKGDETIKVAVTGDLPPMDYMTADGSFAGFNTAILAEIGKRLGKKIELKQVDSAARAISLSSNEVDVVFWTRVGTGSSDDDDREKVEKGQEQNISGENEEKLKEIEETLNDSGYWMQVDKMDVPEGTIVTDPYYIDRLVRVGIK